MPTHPAPKTVTGARLKGVAAEELHYRSLSFGVGGDSGSLLVHTQPKRVQVRKMLVVRAVKAFVAAVRRAERRRKISRVLCESHRAVVLL